MLGQHITANYLFLGISLRLNELRPRVEAEVRANGVTAPIKSLCELDDVRRGTEVVLLGTVAKVKYVVLFHWLIAFASSDRCC